MPTMMSAFNFTPADLDANQHGYMTKEQRVMLRKTRWIRLLPILIIIGICASVLLIAVFVLIFQPGRIQRPPLVLACAVSSLAIITTIISLSAVHDWRQFDTDMRKGEVGRVSGRVSLRIWGGYAPNVSCRLRIQSMEFSISEAQLLALKDGESYTTYFAPNSKVILSVEPL